ncbi:MAG: serine/threonine protein kinase [Lachnospiraceae bacterium]|nr:serine/threonine protein kinase [Butyrivibrio sp.]MCM1343017.1 serine/threonine protein kinase [Muribaculaceae bacterium]MCM1410748.1 serine/threonine protein kinase [Lachnospiraceae bacterium]
MPKQYCPYCMSPVPEGETCSVCGLTEGTYVSSPHHLPPGTVLMDRYLVGRVLGEGGFGITYIGCDTRLELKVAIKEYYPLDRATRNASASLAVTGFIGPSAKSFERGKQKFLSEAQVMARLDKQQVIVSVRDFFEINNTAYIVMEYIEGVTFHELVEQKGGRIAPEEFFPMIEPLFHALSIMHEHGLIHRDISPDNLMLENGKIRLLDFGCAREASRGTETMTIALKHGYAPIEQYQQKGQGPWTDLYALCATIYYCLTGRVPPQALDRITEDELLLPSKLGVNLTEAQEKALLKGMRLQPNRRFANAEELWAALYTTAPENSAAVIPFHAPRTETETPATSETEPEIADSGIVSADTSGKDDLQPGKAIADIIDKGKPDSRETAPKAAGGYNGDATGAAKVTGNNPRTSDTAKAGDISSQTAESADGYSTETEDFPAARNTPATPKWKTLLQNKKFLIPAGTAATCVLIIAGVALFRSGTRETMNPGQESTENLSTESSQASAQVTPDEAAPSPTDHPESPDPGIFESAYRLTESDVERFQELMEDSSVSAVILEGQWFNFPETLIITKPVMVAEGTAWDAVNLTVEENGFLQIDGRLNMPEPGLLRLVGDSARMTVSGTGTFYTKGMVWMDQEECLVMDGQWDSEENAHVLVFSEGIFEKEDVVSVKDLDTLERVARLGVTASIDENITLPFGLGITSPIRISEGVEVTLSLGQEFQLGGDGLLLNNGTINGIYLCDNAVMINRGTLTGEIYGWDGGGFWIQDNSALINYGSVDACDVSRLWDDSLLLNMGTITAYDYNLTGGDMANFGTIDIPTDNGQLFISGGSWFLNGPDGVVTAASLSSLTNRGRIRNEGEIHLQTGSLYRSALLENNGVFRVDSGSSLDTTEGNGLYYGSGEYSLSGSRAKVWPTIGSLTLADREWLTVSTEEELIQAMENPDVREICIETAVTVNSDLIVRKDLYLTQNGSLTLADGAALTDYGGLIKLYDQSSLRADNITLCEDSQLYMEGGATLEVNPGGSLTLDSALFWGLSGNIRLSGTDITLKNNSGFLFQMPDTFDVADSAISLESGSTFTTPYQDGSSLRNAAFTIPENAKTASMILLADTEMTDCTLNIDGGILLNTAADMTFQNCSVNIGKSGYLQTACGGSHLNLLGGSSLEVWGIMDAAGWDEASLTVHGSFKNHGIVQLNVPVSLSEPIINEGTIYYNARENARHLEAHGVERLDLSQITGNPPIDRVVENIH